MHILLISYPYSWCYIPPAGAHTDPKAGGFILVVVLREIISIWSCSVGGMWGWWWWVLLPHSRFSWGSVLWFVMCFYTLFFLHWIEWWIHFTSKFTVDIDYIHMRYYLFFLCATPETILVQLCICISLASRGELFVAVSAPESSLYLISYHPSIPLHCSLCFHFSGPLLSQQAHDGIC